MRKLLVLLFISFSSYSQYREGYIYIGKGTFLVKDYIYNDSKLIITTVNNNKMNLDYENVDSIFIESLDKSDIDFLQSKNVKVKFNKLIEDGTPYLPEIYEYSSKNNISINGIGFNVVDVPNKSADEIFTAVKLWKTEQIQNKYGEEKTNYVDEENRIISDSFFHNFLFTNGYRGKKPEAQSICCKSRAKLTLTVQVKDGKFRYKVNIGKLVGEKTFSSSTGYFGSTSGYYYPSGHDKLLSEIILSKNGVERNNWTLNFRENSILEIIKIDKLVREGILSYVDKVIVDNDDW